MLPERRPRHARVAADQLPRAQPHHCHGRAFLVALGVEVLGFAREASFSVLRLAVAARPDLVRVAHPSVELDAVLGVHQHATREVA